MTTRRRRLRATTSVLLLSLCPGRALADPSEWETAEKITRDRIAEASAALPGGGGPARSLAEIAEYAARATAEWRDGLERRKLQEAGSLLQRNTERINADLRTATEAAAAASTRLRHSGVLEKIVQLETAAKEAGARLAGRWERERAMREREREQREREAGERAREQRR